MFTRRACGAADDNAPARPCRGANREPAARDRRTSLRVDHPARRQSRRRRRQAAWPMGSSSNGGSRKMTSNNLASRRRNDKRVGAMRFQSHACPAPRRSRRVRAPVPDCGRPQPRAPRRATTASSDSAPLPANASSVCSARQVLAEPVEQRLAHAIGCRSHAFARGKAHATAAPMAADDANLVGE